MKSPMLSELALTAVIFLLVTVDLLAVLLTFR
jgi:hypothetical protein